MIQDERLDQIRIIAVEVMADLAHIDDLVKGEDRPMIRSKLDLAMKHLYAFYDQLESACRGECSPPADEPDERKKLVREVVNEAMKCQTASGIMALLQVASILDGREVVQVLSTLHEVADHAGRIRNDDTTNPTNQS